MTNTDINRAKTPLWVKFKLIGDGVIPEKKTHGASGLDCYSTISTSIEAHSTVKIPLGFAVEIPTGYEGQIRPRSGLSLLGIATILGTVDSDYRGEVSAILQNHSEREVSISKGERIAQLVIAPVAHVIRVQTEALSETERGSNGFGSTGAE
jgi:dUTP pyrophosphatase